MIHDLSKINIVPYVFEISTNIPFEGTEKPEIIETAIIGLTESEMIKKKDHIKESLKKLAVAKKLINDKEKRKIEKLLNIEIDGRGRVLQLKLNKKQIEKLEKSKIVTDIFKTSKPRLLADTYPHLNAISNYNLPYKRGWIDSFDENGKGGEGVIIGINEKPERGSGCINSQLIIPDNTASINEAYTNGEGFINTWAHSDKCGTNHATKVSQSARITAPESELLYIKDNGGNDGFSSVHLVNKSWEYYGSEYTYGTDARADDITQLNDQVLIFQAAGNDCDNTNQDPLPKECKVKGVGLAKNSITVGAMSNE